MCVDHAKSLLLYMNLAKANCSWNPSMCPSEISFFPLFPRISVNPRTSRNRDPRDPRPRGATCRCFRISSALPYLAKDHRSLAAESALQSLLFRRPDEWSHGDFNEAMLGGLPYFNDHHHTVLCIYIYNITYQNISYNIIIYIYICNTIILYIFIILCVYIYMYTLFSHPAVLSVPTVPSPMDIRLKEFATAPDRATRHENPVFYSRMDVMWYIWIYIWTYMCIYIYICENTVFYIYIWMDVMWCDAMWCDVWISLNI